MRALAVSSALAAVIAAVACETANGSGSAGARSAPAPSAVNCADAPQLRQRALDDRRRLAETNSDQERIVAGNRATFYVSLATIADLKCTVTLAQADEALKPALAAAAKAQETHSFYERAVYWSEASYLASQVVPMLVKQLPGSTARS
jgi:hypothetical protein